MCAHLRHRAFLRVRMLDGNQPLKTHFYFNVVQNFDFFKTDCYGCQRWCHWNWKYAFVLLIKILFLLRFWDCRINTRTNILIFWTKIFSIFVMITPNSIESYWIVLILPVLPIWLCVQRLFFVTMVPARHEIRLMDLGHLLKLDSNRWCTMLPNATFLSKRRNHFDRFH